MMNLDSAIADIFDKEFERAQKDKEHAQSEKEQREEQLKLCFENNPQAKKLVSEWIDSLHKKEEKAKDTLKFADKAKDFYNEINKVLNNDKDNDIQKGKEIEKIMENHHTKLGEKDYYKMREVFSMQYPKTREKAIKQHKKSKELQLEQTNNKENNKRLQR